MRERDETFVVTLSAPSRATLARSRGIVTIVNDDATDRVRPRLSGLAIAPQALRRAAAALVRFTLSEPASTTFTLERTGSGKARLIRRFQVPGRAGRNSFGLFTRVPSQLVTPGSYRLTAVPRDATGNSGRAARTGFTVRAG